MIKLILIHKIPLDKTVLLETKFEILDNENLEVVYNFDT